MHQYARLDFHGGCWHLVMANAHDCGRKWLSRDSAISDLLWEGWTIDVPHGKRATNNHEGGRHSYGYALKRTIH